MSSVNVALVDAIVSTAKPVLVSVPRDTTVAELQARVSPAKQIVFVVGGCTPSRAAVIGDLHDACAQDGTLEVVYGADRYMGGELATQSCLCCYSKGPADLNGLAGGGSGIGGGSGAEGGSGAQGGSGSS